MIIRKNNKREIITKGIHIEFSDSKMKILSQNKEMYPLGEFSVVNTDASIKVISCDVPEIREYAHGRYNISDNIDGCIRLEKIIYGEKFLNYNTNYTIFIMGCDRDRDSCWYGYVADDIVVKLNELLEMYEEIVWHTNYEKIDL